MAEVGGIGRIGKTGADKPRVAYNENYFREGTDKSGRSGNIFSNPDGTTTVVLPKIANNAETGEQYNKMMREAYQAIEDKGLKNVRFDYRDGIPVNALDPQGTQPTGEK